MGTVEVLVVLPLRNKHLFRIKGYQMILFSILSLIEITCLKPLTLASEQDYISSKNTISTAKHC
jgi:hypothetical protein